MREFISQPSSQPIPLPEHLVHGSEGQFIQVLFNSLRSAVLYLDQWGRICSANIMAKELFKNEELLGKTVLEFLLGWEDPVNCHQEVLMVARTGMSILGSVERATIHGREHWFQTDKVSVKDDEHAIKGVLLTLDDITSLKNHEVKLQHSEARYRAFVENSQDAIWRFDIDPPIPTDWPKEAIAEAIVKRATLGDCNHVFAEVYGYDDPQSLLGMTLEDTRAYSHTLDTQSFVENDFRLKTQEVVWRTPEGDRVCLNTSANGTIENQHLIEVWGVTRDTTEKQRYIDRLEYQANHDMLTGLPNRVKLQDMVNTAISERRSGDKLALIIIDLDRFKEINDTLGHHVGDQIISKVGPRLKRILNHLEATIARLGGDEFAILLPEVESQRHARAIGEQILGSIRKDFLIDDMSIELRASLGIAICPDQADDFSTLMRYADVAMYCAKQDLSGIEVYDAEEDMHSTKRLSLMNDLGKAIRENQLTLYYQPKIALGNKQVVGVEALARWIHPSMGFVSPAEFIPIAETTDLISEMTDWVLNESLSQVYRWREQGIALKMAVNISARNLLNDNILQKIEWLLHRYSLSPACLELEITESTIMENAERSLNIMQQINNLGINLSIDDFGTGYSSLAYLKKLPVKWLKIDYSFIINMINDEQDQIIVDSTIQMAHSLGLQVVAEGVENAEIIRRLCAMKCEQAQGFHIAKPMPAADFIAWYRQYSLTAAADCDASRSA